MNFDYLLMNTARRWWALTLLLLAPAEMTLAQSITSFTPSSGAAGTVVTLTGTSLSAVTGVTFNDVPTTGLTVVNSTTVTAYVPVGATTGPLKVATSSATGTSVASFTVVPNQPDLTVAVTPAGPVSACGGPTLTAVASTKPFTSSFKVNTQVFATALQPDGKLLVAGYYDYNTTRNNIVRLNVDGTLDATFTPTGSGINYDIHSLAIQPDGKVLVGGIFTTYNGASRPYLLRLNADGTLDTSFALSGSGLNGDVRAITVQPDGKVLIGGSFTNYNSVSRVALARLNANGTLDTSFAPVGVGIRGTLYTIIVQPDSRVLIGGYIEAYNNVAQGSIMRLSANGTPDATFSTYGVVSSSVLAMVLQPNGKLLVSGGFTGANNSPLLLGRVNATGTRDNTFAPTGYGVNNSAYALALQPDGKVLIGGVFTDYNGIVTNRVARLTATGALDATFAPTGTGLSGGVQALSLQPDGKVVVGGSFSNYNGTALNGLVRLNADGTRDATATAVAGATYAWSPSGTTGATVVPALTGGSYQAVATVSGSTFQSNTVTVTPCGNAPTITSFSPTSGPVGTGLTLTGTNLTGTSRLTFTGSSGTVVSNGFTVNAAGTQLTGVVVPSGAQTGPINVVVSGSTISSTGSFTVVPPAITTLSPATAVVGSGAFTLTVSGSNFASGAVVRFNSTDLTTTYVSATQLTAAVPASAVATAGSYPVQVANAVVSSPASAAVTFTVTALTPTITSFSPGSGSVSSSVTVRGTNLGGATAVTLNGTAATSFTAVDATTVTFVVPPGATSGVIRVTTPTGSVSSTGVFTVIPNPEPVITSLSPSSVILESGAFTLTISGGDFVGGAVVHFNSLTLPATPSAAGQIVLAIPASEVREISSFYVTVTNPAPGGGTSAISTSSLFRVVLPEPTITSFTPTSGPVGTTVTVRGTYFMRVKNVGLATLNNPYATTYTVVDATTLTFVMPAGSASGPVGVETSGGTGYSATSFTVTPAPNPAPVVASLAPNTAVAGSTALTLTVNGSGFSTSSVASFNGVALATTYVSATQLTVAVPASAIAAAGTYGVAITSPAPGGGTSASVPFTVTAPAPTITSFTPTTGGPGTTVAITGTNFTGATAVTIGTLAVPGFTVVSATSITLVVPSSSVPVSGLLTVQTPGGTATSATPFGLVLATATGAALPGLRVYPNPAADHLTVMLPGAGAVQVALRDLTGRVVLPLAFLAADQQLRLPAELATGVYILEVHQRDTTASVRVVKQ